jgi:6-phosphogluconate dehydrogenase
MSDKGHAATSDIGLIGLGVMGRNFALNMADHGFTVAGYNRDPVKIELLEKTKTERHAIHVTNSIQALCDSLSRPRSVMMLVPAGKPVDSVIQALEPHLEAGDLIIDSGNSHFSDTDRRRKALEEKGLLFMGMGMSGGESGARHGPSLMPGGPVEGYERVRPILEAVAAHVGTAACVSYLGPGSAGHYVKMVHNGIEYALMQLIAETYDLMKRGLGMHPAELHTVYSRWNQHELNSYLMEITAAIFLQTDERTGQPLIDLICDEAKQKGTGEWTVAEALGVQVPTLNIDVAVMMRHMSGYKEQRQAAAKMLKGPAPAFAGDRQPFVDRLENALYAAFIVTYAQGMALLKGASQAYGYQLDLQTVARIWTGGCIIRAALLAEIQAAYRSDPNLANLLLAPQLNGKVQTRQADLRAVVRTAVELGVPVPGLMMALAYWDAYRSGRLPANLIMAQRDYFGAHTYQRLDAKGTFHTRWGNP